MTDNERERSVPSAHDGNETSEFREDDREETAGPLSYFPSFRFALPALLVFLLCFAATVLSPVLNFRELLWASGRSVFAGHQYWRLVTTIFLHGDMQHLLANTPMLLIFGWFLRAFFGLKIFPLAALGTGIVSNLLSLFYYQPDVRLIGASGMVYGMAALWLVFYVKYETGHSPGKRIFRAAGFSLALLFPTTFQSNISYIAHAAGFFSGILIALAALPFVEINMNVERKDKK